jgi:hypothetical protein
VQAAVRAAQEAENARIQEERRSNRIRLVQTAVELVKLVWEIANRLWR